MFIILAVLCFAGGACLLGTSAIWARKAGICSIRKRRYKKYEIMEKYYDNIRNVSIATGVALIAIVPPIMLYQVRIDHDAIVDDRRHSTEFRAAVDSKIFSFFRCFQRLSFITGGCALDLQNKQIGGKPTEACVAGIYGALQLRGDWDGLAIFSVTTENKKFISSFDTRFIGDLSTINEYIKDQSIRLAQMVIHLNNLRAKEPVLSDVQFQVIGNIESRLKEIRAMVVNYYQRTCLMYDLSKQRPDQRVSQSSYFSDGIKRDHYVNLFSFDADLTSALSRFSYNSTECSKISDSYPTKLFGMDYLMYYN